ncbi:zinc finger C2HC domain-containing protein 1C [Onychomys torridus]|uniref:zinc finger C2HC domain-containing protein 1C n=1 Tax=Onychomys torridus TaxID=38674 RepID=UPI00167FB7CB|nr:zinc finger C2HC domain-containing protein 1C [Onychomys torridus]
MAGLQLAPHLPVGVMFPHNKTEAPGLHSAKHDPCEQGDSSQRSSMGHLRNSFQQKLWSGTDLGQGEDVSTHPKRKVRTKARRHSCPPHRASASQQSSGSNPQGQGKGLCSLSSPQPRYPKANNQDFIPFRKKRVGVDRAYPLKPMVHRKSHTGEAGTDGDQNVYPRLPEFSDSDFGLRSWVNPSMCASVRAEKVMAELHRTEWTQIQRLEAAGETLRKEIRRKEILLREKLKKTEEGLRRIRKEQKQAPGNEETGLRRTTGPGGRVRDGSSKATHTPSFSPEVSSEAVCSSSREDQPRERAQANSSPRPVSGYEVQRFKRDRLMASNNRIPDAGPSADEISQPSEEPGSALRASCPPGRPDSSGSSASTEEPELGKCGHCGRSFLLLRLQRHSTVCGRAQGAKRKVFDSSRARAKGTELEQYLNWKGPDPAKTEPPRKSTWRQKHESFIRTLRHARQVQQVIARGGNPSDLPPVLPAENPDYVQCPHCSRHFAPTVAERHIPKCKTLKNRPPPPRRRASREGLA